MQTTSDLYKELLANGATKEIKIEIAGEVYGEDRISSLFTTGSLFSSDTLSVGGAVARQIDVVLKNYGSIPKMAKLVPYYRLVNGDTASEWIQKGIFYIDTRQEDNVTGTLTIHGFDAMLKSSILWEPDQTMEFPMTCKEAAGIIADKMDVALDNPEDIDSDSRIVDYPANEYTMRNILQFIAAAHAANFVMTDTGRLRMVKINGIENAETSVFVGDKVAASFVSPAFDPISKVVVKADEDNAWVAGDDTGYAIEVTFPYGSQEMADRILSDVIGFVYKPFSAEDALVDQAVELGDAVTVNGVYSVLAQQDIYFDALMAGRISAPGEKEVESEYPYQTKEQQVDYKLAKTRSEITKTAEEIRLEIAGVSGELSSLSQTVNGFDARIENAEGAAAEASLRLDGFTVTTYDKDGNVASVSLAKGVVTADSVEAGISLTAPVINAGTVNGSTIILRTPMDNPYELTGAAIHVSPEGLEYPIGSIYYHKIDNPLADQSTHNLFITTQEGDIVHNKVGGALKIRSGFRLSLEAKMGIYIKSDNNYTYFGGNVDFTNATVTGLTASASVAVFG